MRVSDRQAGLEARVPLALPDDGAVRRSSTVQMIATLIFIMLGGIALGLSTTYDLVVRRFDIGAVHFGAWAYWPNVGTARIDPYARAIFASTGQVPLAAGEGLVFVADKDDTGRRLERTCAYRVSGSMPSARNWTIAVATPDGVSLPNPAGRHGFAASELVRPMDGSFTIDVAPRARPGNWLPVTGQGTFVLVLRLYDTSFAADSGNAGRSPFPLLQRQDCSPS